MNRTVTLDRAGRVVLPKPLRTELRLEPGDVLELEMSGELLSLRPVRSGTPLHRERGVWVYRTGRPLTAETASKVLREMRAQRGRRSTT
ncbi:MAG TPA: AbrB/MazE/SpoVT family DNA-binding domain-containing protein [Bryobacteraceae bacterium]|nr:AbrB/MazE/SpoVT family DNA-binding domain-containing protein [Bryobacteraceae bacterium]